jgi:hypothetical protein
LGLVRALSRGRLAHFVLALGLCSVAACLNLSSGEVAPSPPTSGVAGDGQFVGPSTGPSTGPSVGGGSGCVPANPANPVFAAQAFSERTLFARDFYTWTTDEQALALRADKVGCSRSRFLAAR